jgi:hypothetical protein
MSEIKVSKVASHGAVEFSPKREYYEIGDTITVGLNNGQTAIYTLTEIK